LAERHSGEHSSSGRRVLAPFVIRWLDRRRPGQAVETTHDARQRRVMLQRVRYKWITGVLEPSLAHAAQLALGLERRPDTLELGARVLHGCSGPYRVRVGWWRAAWMASAAR
jgi:hypothetical protein